MRGGTRAERADILVVGGGPAGCAAALGLARCGFEVVLVATPRRPAVSEGLSERVVRLLEQAGHERALATLGPSVRREASWHGVTTSANVEWVVERAAFDRALLEDVSAAGVRTVMAPVRRLRPAEDHWQGEAGGHAYRAGFLVEARGRRAPGRRRHGPPAIALVQTWSGLCRQACTAVAPFAEGFAWFATTGNGLGSLQLVVASGRAADREASLAERLASVPTAHTWLDGGRPCGPVTVRHAGTSRTQAPLEPARIRIGDAALALDPLSGHGVFEALASATAAVPVVTTLLRRPVDAALARVFYEERVEQAFLRFARTARDFYRLEERWHDAPFWSVRRNWPDDLPAHESPSAAAPQIATRPVIEDGVVVAREVIVTADHPRGVFQVDGVPLVALLRAVHTGEARRIEKASRRLDRTSEQVGTALAWLRYRGLLRS
jgi:flavin-dependent dehydrogenase